jgi:hypothetical protein
MHPLQSLLLAVVAAAFLDLPALLAVLVAVVVGLRVAHLLRVVQVTLLPPLLFHHKVIQAAQEAALHQVTAALAAVEQLT